MKRSTKSDDKSPDDSENKAKRAKKKDTKAGAGFDTRWRFKVEPQPPKFPFKGEFFELNVYLVDQDGVLKANYVVPITLDLFVEGESVPVCNTGEGQGSSSIEIDPNTPPVIDKSGCAKIRVKVCELSMNRNNRKFCFVVKRQAGPRGDLPREVNPVMTRAMLVINAQIKITNALPEVWYKDQGGRDKCLDLDLELHGPHGIVVGQEVPVRCALLYEDYQMAINQEVLQPSPNTLMAIDKSGRSKIRVRIEDVSKNHQSKNFRIRVEPDTSKTPIHFDKSPDISTPVLVRSKLNRRQKLKLAMQPQEELKGEEAVAVAAIKAAQARRAAESNGPGSAASGTVPPGAGAFAAAAAAAPPVIQQQVNDFTQFAPEVATALWCYSARNTMATFCAVMSQFVHSFDIQILPTVKRTLDQHGGFEALCEQAMRNGEQNSLASRPSVMAPNGPTGSLGGSSQFMGNAHMMDMPHHSVQSRHTVSLLPTHSVDSIHSSMPQEEEARPRRSQRNSTRQAQRSIVSPKSEERIPRPPEDEGSEGQLPSHSINIPPLDRGMSTSSQGLYQLMRGTTQLLRGISGTFGGTMPSPSLRGSSGAESFMAAPEFTREFSVLSLPGGPEIGVSRMHSLAPMQDDDVLGLSSSTRRYRSSGSRGVAFLLKSLYKTNDVIKGLPGFDKDKRLVGFYCQAKDSAITFTSADIAFQDQPQTMSAHVRNCEEKFASLAAEGSSLVYPVNSTEDGYNAATSFFREI